MRVNSIAEIIARPFDGPNEITWVLKAGGTNAHGQLTSNLLKAFQALEREIGTPGAVAKFQLDIVIDPLMMLCQLRFKAV
jgi:hypothetical protein